MMTLSRELKDKLELAHARGFAARLLVTPVGVAINGASYRVSYPDTGSVHHVYIGKQNGAATFHCDCADHLGERICPCAATALAAYKRYLVQVQAELDAMLPQITAAAPSFTPSKPKSKVLQFTSTTRRRVEAELFQTPVAQRG